MDWNDKRTMSRINWSAVSQVYHNLPVIWGFLMALAIFNPNNNRSSTYHINLYRVCLDIAWLLGNDKFKKYTLFFLVQAYDNVGRFHDQNDFCKQLLEILERTEDEFDEKLRVYVYNKICGICFSLGQINETYDNLIRLLGIYELTGNLKGVGKTKEFIGIVHKARAEYDDAMKCYNEALKIFRQTGNLERQRGVWMNIGVVHMLRGEYDQGMECYKKSLQIRQGIGGNRIVSQDGIYFCNIGYLYLHRRQYDKALKCYEDALEIFRRTDSYSNETQALLNIGDVHYYIRRDLKKAMECFKGALQISRQIGHLSNLEGSALLNVGVIHSARAQYGEAMKFFNDALLISQSNGELLMEAKVRISFSSLFVDTLDFAAAEDHLTQSISCFERIFSMLAKHCPSKISIVDTYIDVYRLLTIVLVTLGKTEKALLATERRRSQALRDKILDKYDMESQFASARDGYKDLDLLISSKNTTFVTYFVRPEMPLFIFPLSQARGLAVEELSESRLVVPMARDLSNTEEQNVFQWCVKRIIEDADKYLKQIRENTFEDRSLGREKKFSQHEQTLQETSYLLRNFPLQSFLKRDTNGKVSKQESVLMNGKRASKSATENDEPKSGQGNSALLSNEEGNGSGAESNVLQLHESGEDLLKDLYKALIAPIEKELDQPEMAIIPDGPLFFVPFSALQAPDGQFLSDAKHIRIGPSLTTLKILKEYPIEKQSTTGALVIGGPCVRNVMWDGEFSEQPFDDLPYAWDEAENIGELLHETPLIKDQATKDAVMSRLREGVAVIHIATHGSGDRGLLLLAPEPRTDQKVPTEADYMLTVKEISSCNINAQLVVLSCCHTGGGEVRAEGVVGLARAFLEAGARSVLATLWQVSDQGTLYFMDSFYRHLTSGKSACTSLQEAMREMRARPRWSHWAYWGSFFILGHDVTPFSVRVVTH